MKYFFYPFQWMWRMLFYVNAIITFFIFYPLFFIFLSREKWFPLVFKLKKVWGRFLLFPIGIFFQIKRKPKLDKNRAYVFCPNHTSYIDIMLIYILIPVYFHTMGKAELLKVPLFKKFFERMNIPVNRKSVLDSHRAFIRAGSDMDKGISVALFPEGTINHTGPVVGRFKNGPFKLAIDKQVPIVPITFLNNWKIFPDDPNKKLGLNRRFVGRPGIAGIIMHDPIETKGMTDKDIEFLKQKVHDIISEPLKKKYPDFQRQLN
jgi:1-acyl-sn-glycerol-3-phosphate acyltransferase